MATDEEFPYFKYDLPQDILHCDNEVACLEHHALIVFIGYCYKKSGIPKRIRTWYKSEKKTELLGRKEWWLFENDIEEKLKKLIEKKSNLVFDWNFVRLKIHFIGQQIHDFVAYKIHHYEFLRIYLKNLVFTNQGSINILNTVYRILRTDSLGCSYQEFKLACSHFLEEDIVEFFFQEHSESCKKSLIANAHVNKDFAIYFWIWKLTGSRKKINNIMALVKTKSGKIRRCTADVNDSVAFQHVFREAVASNNDMAVHYLWTHYVSNLPEVEFVLEDVLEISIKFSCYANINMFLISKLKNNELKTFLKKHFYNIIINLAVKIRWHCVFHDVFKALQHHFNNQDFVKILSAITEDYYRYSFRMDLSLIQKVLLTLPESFKEYLLQNTSDKSGYVSYYEILKTPFEMGGDSLIKVFLKIGNPLETHNFLTSEHGVDLLAKLITKGNFELTDNLLEEFVIQDPIHEVSMTSKDESQKFYYDHIFLEEFKGLKEFEDLFSVNINSEIVNLKLHILHKSVSTIENMVFSKIDDKFQVPDEILLWCLGSETLRDSFKRIFIILIEEEDTVKFTLKMKWYYYIREAVLQKSFDFLSKLCDWKNCSTAEKVNLGDELLSDHILLETLTIKEEFVKITDFIEWVKCFLKTSDDKISAFKSKVKEKVRVNLAQKIKNIRARDL